MFELSKEDLEEVEKLSTKWLAELKDNNVKPEIGVSVVQTLFLSLHSQLIRPEDIDFFLQMIKASFENIQKQTQ